MKKTLLPLLLFAFVPCCAQQSAEAEKKVIMEKVNQFFIALEKRDTVLYNSVVLTGGQIWTVRRLKDTLKTSMRSFTDDMFKLVGMNTVIEERPLSYEIKIHQDIAVAWVPYTLSLSGKFSHCGVDVFTLIRTMNGWKIVNAAYSVEPDGCASLKINRNSQ
jgi:hypothetical protein